MIGVELRVGLAFNTLALLTVHKLVGSGLTYYLSLRMAGLSWYKADALATALQSGYRLAELSSQREVVELLRALQCRPGPVWLGGNSIGRQHNTEFTTDYYNCSNTRPVS